MGKILYKILVLEDTEITRVIIKKLNTDCIIEHELVTKEYTNVMCRACRGIRQTIRIRN